MRVGLFGGVLWRWNVPCGTSEATGVDLIIVVKGGMERMVTMDDFILQILAL